jgi:hypothetical protein
MNLLAQNSLGLVSPTCKNTHNLTQKVKIGLFLISEHQTSLSFELETPCGMYLLPVSSLKQHKSYILLLVMYFQRQLYWFSLSCCMFPK